MKPTNTPVNKGKQEKTIIECDDSDDDFIIICEDHEVMKPTRKSKGNKGKILNTTKGTLVKTNAGTPHVSGAIITINEPKISYVYFIIEEPFSGSVKIGKADNVERRIKQLQTGNKLTLKLYGRIPTMEPFILESHFHRKYKANQIKNEWFKMNLREVDRILESHGVLSRPGLFRRLMRSFFMCIPGV